MQEVPKDTGRTFGTRQMRERSHHHGPSAMKIEREVKMLGLEYGGQGNYLLSCHEDHPHLKTSGFLPRYGTINVGSFVNVSGVNVQPC